MHRSNFDRHNTYWFKGFRRNGHHANILLQTCDRYCKVLIRQSSYDDCFSCSQRQLNVRGYQCSPDLRYVLFQHNVKTVRDTSNILYVYTCTMELSNFRKWRTFLCNYRRESGRSARKSAARMLLLLDVVESQIWFCVWKYVFFWLINGFLCGCETWWFVWELSMIYFRFSLFSMWIDEFFGLTIFLCVFCVNLKSFFTHDIFGKSLFFSIFTKSI